jgi:hypothetical protein
VSVDPVSGPAQNPREVVVAWHRTSLPQPRQFTPLHRFLRRAVIRVPQQFLDGLDVFAIRLHERPESMPEGVPTHTSRNAGRFESRF